MIKVIEPGTDYLRSNFTPTIKQKCKLEQLVEPLDTSFPRL